MQLAKLDYAIGGVIIYNSFPLPPLFDMPKNGNTPTEAKKNATYYGQDMRFMVCYGENDIIFPPPVTQKAYHDIFDVLEIRDTLKVDHIEPSQGHMYTETEFDTMVEFIGATPGPHTNGMKFGTILLMIGAVALFIGLVIFLCCKCFKKSEKTFLIGNSTPTQGEDATPLNPESTRV